MSFPDRINPTPATIGMAARAALRSINITAPTPRLDDTRWAYRDADMLQQYGMVEIVHYLPLSDLRWSTPRGMDDAVGWMAYVTAEGLRMAATLQRDPRPRLVRRDGLSWAVDAREADMAWLAWSPSPHGGTWSVLRPDGPVLLQGVGNQDQGRHVLGSVGSDLLRGYEPRIL